ncbi:UDP-N-acetylglucosamine 2-epimerase [Aquabacterium sp.]|uniref:UDP-N-acetylglucosamine 2-epimerase n=1 Tax=Aquabacterium sp. TaxID=1872578 RepID=UPI004037F2A5
MPETVRRVVFLTGTRADFGKLKPLMQRLQADPQFEIHLFVTGMHMLSKYGYTCEEVQRAGFGNIYKYINQNASDSMDHILAKTILGLSDYIREIRPDLIVVHGDRVEALAGAAVGALNNVLTGHIEGGEVSGTVDELIRHSVTKLSHIHFVANEEAFRRLVQLGESRSTVHVIGSPDVDVMNSQNLPSLDEVMRHYEIPFSRYGVMTFHSVTSELDDIRRQARMLVDAVLASGLNYVVIYPNNDHGTDHILDEYKRLQGNDRFRVFPSMRFEYFLTTLKNADFIIGNSSAGVREAPHFGVPAINVGTRQNNRTSCKLIVNVPAEAEALTRAMSTISAMPRESIEIFGNGNSAEQFHRILCTDEFWAISTQKYFNDLRAAPASSGETE